MYTPIPMRMAAPATDPITIPAIAPPLRWELDSTAVIPFVLKYVAISLLLNPADGLVIVAFPIELWRS